MIYFVGIHCNHCNHYKTNFSCTVHTYQLLATSNVSMSMKSIFKIRFPIYHALPFLRRLIFCLLLFSIHLLREMQFKVLMRFRLEIQRTMTRIIFLHFTLFLNLINFTYVKLIQIQKSYTSPKYSLIQWSFIREKKRNLV